MQEAGGAGGKGGEARCPHKRGTGRGSSGDPPMGREGNGQQRREVFQEAGERERGEGSRRETWKERSRAQAFKPQ